jgi:hypothetical protein
MGGFQIDPHPKRPITGQLIANSGSVTGLPNVDTTRALIRALPGNDAAVYVGSSPSGTLSAQSGFPLAAIGEPIYLEGLRNLNDLQLVTLADGDGIGFLALYDPNGQPL